MGFFTRNLLYTELGDIIKGMKAGRENDQELTIFISVGIAAMDVIVAKKIYNRAIELGVGQKVSI
ncbi:hypothetical protein [Niallia sp. 01092]|uniref:hypothetical protein n=1 Tax=unclassified Niallia TaxID=2837522 RepID=UPI003FD3EEC6